MKYKKNINKDNKNDEKDKKDRKEKKDKNKNTDIKQSSILSFMKANRESKDHLINNDKNNITYDRYNKIIDCQHKGIIKNEKKNIDSFDIRNIQTNCGNREINNISQNTSDSIIDTNNNNNEELLMEEYFSNLYSSITNIDNKGNDNNLDILNPYYFNNYYMNYLLKEYHKELIKHITPESSKKHIVHNEDDKVIIKKNETELLFLNSYILASNKSFNVYSNCIFIYQYSYPYSLSTIDYISNKDRNLFIKNNSINNNTGCHNEFKLTNIRNYDLISLFNSGINCGNEINTVFVNKNFTIQDLCISNLLVNLIIVSKDNKLKILIECNSIRSSHKYILYELCSINLSNKILHNSFYIHSNEIFKNINNNYNPIHYNINTETVPSLYEIFKNSCNTYDNLLLVSMQNQKINLYSINSYIKKANYNKNKIPINSISSPLSDTNTNNSLEPNLADIHNKDTINPLVLTLINTFQIPIPYEIIDSCFTSKTNFVVTLKDTTILFFSIYNHKPTYKIKFLETWILKTIYNKENNLLLSLLEHPNKISIIKFSLKEPDNKRIPITRSHVVDAKFSNNNGFYYLDRAGCIYSVKECDIISVFKNRKMRFDENLCCLVYNDSNNKENNFNTIKSNQDDKDNRVKMEVENNENSDNNVLDRSSKYNNIKDYNYFNLIECDFFYSDKENKYYNSCNKQNDKNTTSFYCKIICDNVFDINSNKKDKEEDVYYKIKKVFILNNFDEIKIIES